jgi:hypothetical protein
MQLFRVTESNSRESTSDWAWRCGPVPFQDRPNESETQRRLPDPGDVDYAVLIDSRINGGCRQ